jgi:hypothetical protein
MRAGNTAAAKSAFAAAKVSDSYGDLLELWKLYASTKG